MRLSKLNPSENPDEISRVGCPSHMPRHDSELTQDGHEHRPLPLHARP
jgi:hypothetical protein